MERAFSITDLFNSDDGEVLVSLDANSNWESNILRLLF